MKKAAWVIVACALVFSSQAQESPQTNPAPAGRNMGFDISAGYSMVLGHYGKDDRENEKSGYATSGWYVGLNYALLGKKNFGLGVNYTYQRNSLADSAAYWKVDGKNFPLGTGVWSNHYLMIGPVFSQDFGKWMLDVRLLGGGMLAFSPLFYTQDPYTGSIDKNMGAGFAMQFSVGIGYRIAPQWAVFVQVGYLGATAIKDRSYQFMAVDTLWNQNHTQIIGLEYSTMVNEIEMKKPVSAFNTGLGIKFNF